MGNEPSKKAFTNIHNPSDFKPVTSLSDNEIKNSKSRSKKTLTPIRTPTNESQTSSIIKHDLSHSGNVTPKSQKSVLVNSASKRFRVKLLRTHYSLQLKPNQKWSLFTR